MSPPSMHNRGFVFMTVLLAFSSLGCEEASTTAPEVPGGGQEFVLDYEAFKAGIDEIFTRRGCDSANCHGGGIRGTFALSPGSDKNIEFDYDQASLQVDALDREASALLLKPLASDAGGAAHAGDSPTSTFASVEDPDYIALYSWIMDGELR